MEIAKMFILMYLFPDERGKYRKCGCLEVIDEQTGEKCNIFT
jgi:hypothetical protein